MPQVASTPVISPPVRSDAPARVPGQGASSGGFGEMLDASAAPDAGGSKAAPAKNETAAPAAQEGQAADLSQITNPPVASIDLALITGELAVEGNAAIPAAAAEADDGNADPSGDDVAEGTDEAAGDAASTAPDPKAAEVTPAVVLAPPPALAIAPAPPPAPAAAAAPADADIHAIFSREPTSSTPPPSRSVPAVPVTAAGLHAPAADPDAALPPQAANPSGTLAETVSGNQTTTPGAAPPSEAVVLPTQRPATEAANVEAEDRTEQSAEAAAALPGQTDAKPSARPAAERGNEKTEDKLALPSKTGAHPAEIPHPGKAADAHPAADAANAAEQAASTDAKPAAHQPHPQPSEHAPATARVAVTAAHSDVPAPDSVAQAVTAQAANPPPPFGLNAAIPLASPLQSLWQPAAQRAESADNAIPISGLAVEIVSRARDGERRFEIRLDPPELGRIDVRLDIDRGGNVTSRLTVERAETLDLLRRDAPQLERALQHAGLNTEGGLQFSLRDQSFANRDQTRQNTPTLIVPDDEPAAAETARRGYGRLIGLGSGIDIRV